VSPILADNLDAILDRGVRLIANAGGLDPLSCRTAIEALGQQLGRHVAVAAVTGDDVLPLAASLARSGGRAADGGPIPPALLSANAYLGARPIVEALRCGAEIVVTGRVVDSALVLAPLVHELGWSWTDYDRLAQGTLAGHVIECGAQATGGLFTDWEQVPAWDAIGYPLVECDASGSFVVTKLEGTGGLVSAGAVAEQVVYEVGDPAAYAMPDVVCDLRDVRLEPAGEHRVRVTGARGRPPGRTLKVSATWSDGFQIDSVLLVRGRAAAEKARKTADALLARTRRQMERAGFGDYREVVVELLGCETLYGPHARVADAREVVLRLAVSHDSREALEFLRREAPSAGTSMGPGTRGHIGGRARIRPTIRLSTFYVDAGDVHPVVHFAGDALRVEQPRLAGAVDAAPQNAVPPTTVLAAPDEAPGVTVRVPLAAIAWARSGDKGDDCNIGVIARRPELFPVLRRELSADRVAGYFAHLIDGPVERFELAGLGALNFVLHRALGGGGAASLRSDPLGKSYAQMLLDMEVDVPAALVPR
jgi:hypothetical protein